MLTQFGKEVRKLRLDKELRLCDLADRLNVSAAFVSAIESGRKYISDGYVASVGKAMNLSEEEFRRLERAADHVRSEIAVGRLPGDQRELLAAFSRRLDEVPPHVLEALRKAVLE